MKPGYMTNDVKVMVQSAEIERLKKELRDMAKSIVRRLSMILNNKNQSDSDKLAAVAVLSAQLASKYNIEAK